MVVQKYVAADKRPKLFNGQSFLFSEKEKKERNL